MLRTLLAIAVLAGCNGEGGTGGPVDSSMPDAEVPAACVEATTYQNLASIETKIFKPSCTFSGCHNGAATDAGRLDLREGMAYAEIVNISSEIETTRKYIVPGQPNQSWLLLMLGHIPPGEMSPPAASVPAVGLMPLNNGGQLLCVQKREAIVRWIMAGAANN